MGSSSSSSSSSRRCNSGSSSGAGAGGGAGSSEHEAGGSSESLDVFAAAITPDGWKQGYEELVNLIIRPPRAQYDPEQHLGPSEFRHCGKRFRREDGEMVNGRGHKLLTSWWKFHPRDAPAEKLPCVLYLHANASCRIAAFELLQHLLPSAVTVFAMDFAGCGLSEGDYISLGYFEREDVQQAIAQIRESGQVSTIALWGHSMGAATSLMYADRDPTIAAMVLDSPFSDLPQLAMEIGQMAKEQGLRVPNFALQIVLTVIRRTVKSRAKFDLRDVTPIANVDKCFVPALFAHGERDTFIKLSHSKALHEKYAGDKNLILFDGDHNSERPAFFFNSAVIFLRQTLQVKEEHCLDVSSRGGGGLGGLGGHDSDRAVEDDQLRQAMMLSIATATGRSGGLPEIAEEQIRSGAEGFEAVTGAGGTTAQYYVYTALMLDGSIESAIQRYYDCDCAAAPPGWQVPAPRHSL